MTKELCLRIYVGVVFIPFEKMLQHFSPKFKKGCPMLGVKSLTPWQGWWCPIETLNTKKGEASKSLDPGCQLLQRAKMLSLSKT